MASSPKTGKNQVCWAGEKPEDKHNPTKLNLNRDWAIVIFECFVVSYFSSSFGNFKQNKHAVNLYIAEQKLKGNDLIGRWMAPVLTLYFFFKTPNFIA